MAVSLIAPAHFYPYQKKQIPLAFSAYNRLLQYPEMVNLTFLDSIFAYSKTSNGRLFYFDEFESTKSLATLIEQQYLLKNAYSKIGLFAMNKSANSYNNNIVTEEKDKILSN